MSRFAEGWASHQRPGKPACIHVPTERDLKVLSTADLRLILAQAFDVANAVADSRRGHGRTMSELHIQTAQNVLRTAARDALKALQESLRDRG